MGLILGAIIAAAGTLAVAATAKVDADEPGAVWAKLSNDLREVAGKTYEHFKVTYGDGRSATGYIEQSEAEQLNLQTKSIPANFAGLEAVMMPPRLEEQLFRVYDVDEQDDYVVIRARHVWYDNRENYTLWQPDQNQSYSAGDACRNVLNNALSPVASRVATDCTDTLSGKELDYARKNLIEAFLDPEKGICAKYKLSLIRNNWDFYCLKEVGYDRGIVIQDKKNLLGVERHESYDEVYTRLAPYAKDESGNIVWLNNNGTKYLDSDHIDDYSHPRALIYDSGLQIGKGDVTAANVQAKLLASAQKRYDDEKIDLPSVDMQIEFISLGDTEEYAQYRGLDKVYLYDTLTVINSERGYNYTAQVVGVVHDILTGMLQSVTIGKLDNWNGVRKIAVWQVPEINGENIRLKSILAGSYGDASIAGAALMNGSITADHIAAHTITADEIAAGTITATEIAAGTITSDKIDVDDLAAAFATVNVLNAAIANIAEAEIASANIGFAQIKDANIQNLIARDAVTDKYFIDKLAVRSAQMVQATVGELIVKASDDKYYRLDINAQGALTPTDVTSSLSTAEKNAGVTSDGHSSIIETDLTVADLSASNMKAINALIDKLTAARIDVDELFARQATITKLNTVDIRGNTYLQMMVSGFGTNYTQWSDPATAAGNTVRNGDVWNKGNPLTYSQMAGYTYSQLANYTHKGLEGYVTYARKGGAWVLIDDPIDARHQTTMIALDVNSIALKVEDTWEGMARISLESSRIEARVKNNENGIAALVLQTDQIALSLSDKYGIVSGIAIAVAGVAVSGNKYIKLDVNANNYVHIDQNGIEVMGNRIKVNGKEVFARDDIIIMNPNASESWRQTVAGIEGHMSGKSDWVLIRPYYDAKILWNLFATYTIQASSVGGNVAQLQQEAGLAASFGTSTAYQYIFKFTIPVQNFTELGLGLTLANDQNLTSNVITTSGTYQISAVTPTTIEIVINSAVNLCGENAEIFFKLEATGRNVGGVSDVSLTCKCNATTKRVPCTTYYYP